MKTSDTHAFANQLLVCLLVTLSFSGVIGVGAVWLRHQISATANDNRRREARIAELERRIAETTTMIEGEQGSEALRRRNAEWKLGLVPASDAQVVRVTSDDLSRHAARRNREIFNDGLAPAVTFQLAQRN
jgi:hypothetical protein